MPIKEYGPVDAFHTSNAQKLLTTSLVAGDGIDTRAANELWLTLDVGGTAMTSCDFQVECSIDATNYFPIAAHNAANATAGVMDVDGNTFTGPATDYAYGPFRIPAGAKVRVKAKRTGGDATSKVLIRAHLVSA